MQPSVYGKKKVVCTVYSPGTWNKRPIFSDLPERIVAEIRCVWKVADLGGIMMLMEKKRYCLTACMPVCRICEAAIDVFFHYQFNKRINCVTRLQ